jgi:hypothetical protein
VIPDETVDKNRTIKLGGTALELTYLGLNHSDSTLLMRLPKEKVIFAVDFISVGTLPARGMIDSYPLEWEASLKRVLAMDWEKLIPGHPGAGGRLGTKQDVQDILTFLQDASAEVKAAARGEVLGYRRERDEAAEILELAQLRASNAVRPETLLRAMGTWHLSLDLPYGGSVSAVPGTET